MGTDAAFIRHTYSEMNEEQLSALAKKEGAALTPEAFAILKETFVTRNFNLAAITAAEQKRKVAEYSNMAKVRAGRGEKIIQALWHDALFDMKAGKTYQEVLDGMLAKGINEETALSITEGLEIKALELLEKCRKKITTGAVALVCGTAITVYTIFNPVLGFSIVAYGSIMYGGAAFINGLVGLGSYKKILHNCVQQRLKLEKEQEAGV
ncbi:MAG TPA: hypothetical protein VHB48_21865 [Chitinophagaceae bacterium]|jgi:hypothetical protein|nr:hypothetical protein [Chitinophagaceae bacterium]